MRAHVRIQGVGGQLCKSLCHMEVIDPRSIITMVGMVGLQENALEVRRGKVLPLQGAPSPLRW